MLAACAFPAAASAAFSPGAPGAGDPFFPAAGNGGIDVVKYQLRLGFVPSTRQLTGHATLSVKATQDLSRFDLDLRGFSLGTVTVNGAAARVGRSGQQEL